MNGEDQRAVKITKVSDRYYYLRFPDASRLTDVDYKKETTLVSYLQFPI